MGPLYYAGTVDQIKMCIKQVKDLIPDEVKTYVEQYLDVRPNTGAGDPDLSKEWNECLAMIGQLALHYKQR